MLIDHIGYLFYPAFLNRNIYNIFRYVGRIAMPLYAFMVVESIRYSKKPIRYLLQLLIMEIIIDVGEILFLNGYEGCIFSTLFIGGLIIYFLEQEKWYLNLLSILPLSVAILSMYNFFPIKLQYGLYGVIIIVLFYLGYRIASSIYPLIFKVEIIKRKESELPFFTFLFTAIGSLLFTIFVILCAEFSLNIHRLFDLIDCSFTMQTYSLFAIIFLLLYGGKKGYNSSKFKWGCYLFYPVHLIVIYGIYELLLFLK